VVARRPEGTPSGRMPIPPASPKQPATSDQTVMGTIIEDRYRLERLLGSGGMSRVYLGTHVRAGGKLAIKLIDVRLSNKPDMMQRCLQEARTMMEIQSNHVVRAYDVGMLASGQLYIVMEYLAGHDLEQLLQRDGPLPWPRLAAMAVQICNGLATAHAHGTIHRDIKPQNCFAVNDRRQPGPHQADRLRHRPRRQRRVGADAGRGDPRHARVHGARAGRLGHAARRALRHLRGRRDALQDADRGGAVPRTRRPRHAVQAPQRAAGRAEQGGAEAARSRRTPTRSSSRRWPRTRRSATRAPRRWPRRSASPPVMPAVGVRIREPLS
jgi:hypothetical protein